MTLSGFQRDVLCCIATLGAEPGVEIKDALETDPRFDYDLVHHGRLYPNLATLIEDGYVDKTPRNDRSNEYTLTDDAKVWIRSRSQMWSDAYSHLIEGSA